MVLLSASSSLDHWRPSLSSKEEDVACITPLGDNGSMGRGRERCARMGFFVGCKSWERKGALCEDGVFCWLQELGEEEGVVRELGFFCWLQEFGEEKRPLGGRGIFMARGTHLSIIAKTTPEKIRVVVGSVQFKLLQFLPNLHLYLHINLLGSENCILLWMEGGRSEEGGKTIQRNVNGPEEIIVV
jgi:hypothetical protein